ncbi:MAG: hypothetical protein KUF72_01015 [Candidatus Thiodiazotropha sp. (ex Ctena orbiculata)]|nr:hypothetical protein [Candidatus Thiodiazotropha taylori]
MRQSESNTKPNKLDSDPQMDKDIIKQKITRSIQQQVPGSNQEDIFHSVDQYYERLLSTATVFQHIPVLVEGEVRAEVRHKIHEMF